MDRTSIRGGPVTDRLEPRPESGGSILLRFVGLEIGVGVIALIPTPMTGRIHLDRWDYFVFFSCLLAFAVVFGSAIRLAAHLGARALGLVDSAVPRPGRFRIAIVVAANLILISTILHARYVGPFSLRVSKSTLPLSGLKKAVRLVVISDLHSDSRFGIEDRVVVRVNEMKADLVLFLGDALNDPSRIDRFRGMLSRIQARVDRFAIRGNWDVWFWGALDLFGGTGFSELKSGWRTIRVDDCQLHLGAHEWIDEWAPTSVVGDPPRGSGPRVLLYHGHDYIEEAARSGIDLYLCGDTHGGQIALPGYGALFAIGRFGRKYAGGLYRRDNMLAYVTSGLGVEGGFPLRFGVSPEITVVDLVPPEGGTVRAVGDRSRPEPLR